MSKTRAEQGIILEWCECKCHGSPSPHITADGKSQLSNFWGQVGHSRGVANLHNEGMLKSGLDCVPENGTQCVGRSGIQSMTLKIKEVAHIHIQRKCSTAQELV